MNQKLDGSNGNVMNSLGQLHQTVHTKPLIPLVQGVGDTALRVPLVLGLVDVQQVGMAVAHDGVVLPGLRFPCAQQLRVLEVFEPLAGDVDASVLEPVPHTGTVGHGQQESLHLLLEAHRRLVGRHALFEKLAEGQKGLVASLHIPKLQLQGEAVGKVAFVLDAVGPELDVAEAHVHVHVDPLRQCRGGASHCLHQLGRCKSAPAQESAGDALEVLHVEQEVRVLARVSAPGREPRVATPTEAVGVHTAGELQDGVPMHPPFPATSGTGVGFGDNAIVGQGVAIHLLQRTSKHFLAARSCSDGLGLVRVRNCPKVHGGACILELTGGRPQVGELVNGISLTSTLLFRAVCF